MRSYKPITLLTDFGHEDTYVGIVKGVILRVLPQATIVDLCHNIPSHDILRAAFLVYISYPFFPSRSIHLVIVDPGVGSSRRPLLVVTRDHYFIGPDNGVLSYIFEGGDLRRVIEITARHYFLPSMSSSFHGRDIFAPVAAYLCKGIEVDAFGSEVSDFIEIPLPKLRLASENVLTGEILHVDRFGNMITNISHQDLICLLGMKERDKARLALKIGTDIEIKGLRSYYGEGEGGKLEAIIGSSGHVEIYVNQGKANLVSHKDIGDPIAVGFL